MSTKTKPAILATGLALTPALTVACSIAAPNIAIPTNTATILVFVASVTVITASLFALSHGSFSNTIAITITASAGTAVAGTAFAGVNSIAAIAVINAALVGAGHGVGRAVGSRVERAGHLLPACVVAASIDIASVMHPGGPTHAILQSERAMELLTFSFPVFGSAAFAPSIGVGDMVFGALLLGAAVRHGLSTIRMATLIAAGLLIAGLLSAIFARGVPALPAVAACVILGFKQARTLDRKDRWVAYLCMGVAVTIAVGVIATAFLP